MEKHGFESTDTMFSVGLTPWHSLGTVVKDAPTAREAIKLAGLDWTVRCEHPKYMHGVKSRYKGVIRETDGALLGEVSAGWTPVQNHKAFDWFNPFIEAGYCSFETAGSLRGGQVVWILAKVLIEDTDIVPGDQLSSYVLLSNGFDGMTAFTSGTTDIRVVCNNTLAQAHQSRGLIKRRHTRNITQNIKRLGENLMAEFSRHHQTIEAYKHLAATPVTEEQVKRYAMDLFGPKKPAKPVSSIDQVLSMVDMPGDIISVSGEIVDGELIDDYLPKAVEDVVELVYSGKGNDMPGVRDTAWAAYNGAQEYLQYVRGGDKLGAVGRLDELTYGPAATTNQLALQRALEWDQRYNRPWSK